MRVIVVGAGPVGLMAAREAQEAGDAVVVLEAGVIGAELRSWAGLRGWSTWAAWVGAEAAAALGVDPDARPTGNELVTRWLQPLAATLTVRTHQRVIGVARVGDVLRLASEGFDGEHTFDEADRVIWATGPGRWGHAGADGLPLPSEKRAASAGRLRYGPVDPGDLPPGPVMVVGAGPEARAQAEALAAAGREVDWSGGTTPLSGVTLRPPVTRFGRSTEGVTVFVEPGERVHAAQVIVLAGRLPEREALRGVRIGWTPDGAPIPGDAGIHVLL